MEIPKPAPRIMAVHDISCYGKSSLTVVLPVLSALGLEAVPLPTALLSAHTGFSNATFLPLDSEMERVTGHWRSLKLRFDCIYSGFLGSEQQISTVLGLLRDRKGALAAVDPVMGDDGVKYRTYTDGMCEKMRLLVSEADIITPNLTEACLLSGEKYNPDMPESRVLAIARRLNEMGPRTVVITGVRRGNEIGNLVSDVNAGEDKCYSPYVGRRYDGTGDLFASVFIGSLVRGYSAEHALRRATAFTSHTVERTAEANAETIQFEPLLCQLTEEK